MAKVKVWRPVINLSNTDDELIADEIAVTIANDNVAMATFEWPVEGGYAVCELVETEQPTVPDDGLVVNEYQLAGGGPFERSYTLRRMPQRRGPDKWAVYMDNSPLSKELQWEYEPLPSSRDDVYLARCRYDTKEEALAAWRKWLDAQPQPD